jgi:hypothetical protein
MNFYLKNSFHELALSKRLIDRRFEYEKQSILTLNAESAYLNSPKYLQKMATKYLKLKNVLPKQIIKDFDTAVATPKIKNTK